MAGISDIGSGVGYLYITSATSQIITSTLNTPQGAQQLVTNGLTGDSFADGSMASSAKKYYINADYSGTALPGDLTNAVEITQYISNRGLQAKQYVASSTIASGVSTVTRKANISLINIDTEGAAASDDLDTITITGYVDGDIVLLRGTNAARIVTVKNGTGNIFLANSLDFLTGTLRNTITLQYRSASSGFVELARSPQFAIDVPTFRAAGLPTPVSGVGLLTMPTSGTIDIEVGVDKGVQIISGTPVMVGSVVYRAKPVPTIPYLDGDTLIFQYKALPTSIGSDTVTIMGSTLTAAQAAAGAVLVYSVYRLANTTWYTTVIPNEDGIDFATLTDLADYEPYLGLPAADGYVLSSTALGVRSWIPSLSTRYLNLSCLTKDTANAVSNNVAYNTFEMPFDGDLILAEAYVDVAGTTGVETIDILKNGTTVLSTLITIDTTETSSRDAATPPVISVPAFVTGDLITVNITTVHTTPATGLSISLKFNQTA